MDNSNIYSILSNLSTIKKEVGMKHYLYYVGNFLLQMWTYRQDQDDFGNCNDMITSYELIDVNLHERVPSHDTNQHYNHVYLNRDIRFKDYEPIKYTDLFELSNGQRMPLLKLCELIKYLNRLSNLTAFS